MCCFTARCSRCCLFLKRTYLKCTVFHIHIMLHIMQQTLQHTKCTVQLKRLLRRVLKMLNTPLAVDVLKRYAITCHVHLFFQQQKDLFLLFILPLISAASRAAKVKSPPMCGFYVVILQLFTFHIAKPFSRTSIWKVCVCVCVCVCMCVCVRARARV